MPRLGAENDREGRDSVTIVAVVTGHGAKPQTN